jgi:hypothetical protein
VYFSKANQQAITFRAHDHLFGHGDGQFRKIVVGPTDWPIGVEHHAARELFMPSLVTNEDCGVDVQSIMAQPAGPTAHGFIRERLNMMRVFQTCHDDHFAMLWSYEFHLELK